VRARPVVAACAILLALACTVDEVIGSNARVDGGSDGGPPFDGGTPICPGTGIDCTPVCGDQVCHVGCTGIHDCLITCSGTSCSFHCERPGGLTCTPTCAPAVPCTMHCTPAGEEGIDCVMDCNPLQTCAADCHGGTCTVACGQLEPATACDGGVYSCSGTCPP
jgi:hypothetical protein